MACRKCNNTKIYKGLPCTSCQLTLRQQNTIRNNIYQGAPWRAQLLAARLGAARPMVDLIARVGSHVLDHGTDNDKAVLRSDLSVVMKLPVVHLKPGTTVDRVYAELDTIVANAAKVHGLRASVMRSSGSGVVDGIGVGTSTVDSVQVERRSVHLIKAGLSNNMELLNALAKLRPTAYVCIETNHVVSGQRQKGREALQTFGQVLAPNVANAFGDALPGQTISVPWVLYQVVVPEDMPNGSEFHLAADKFHYRPQQFEQRPPPMQPGDLLKAQRDLTKELQPVGKHGACPTCTAIAQDQKLRGFEDAIANATVAPGETHGHECDRKLQEFVEWFRGKGGWP